MTPNITISVQEEVRAFIDAQVAARGYSSPGEYIMALVRDAQKRQAKQELEAKLLEGLDGPLVEMTREEWDSIEQEARARGRTTL